ncbi:MAG: oligosaccharide flippase family protein [Nitrososphaerota archaeon]
MADELTRVAEESTRGGFYLITGTASATVIMAIASIIIARLLGPELYGQYTLSLVTPQLLLLLTDLGVNQGIIKFTAAFIRKNESHRIKRIIKYGLMLRAAAGTLISLLNYLLADLFATVLLQRPELAVYVKIAAISVLFQAIFATITSAFVGLDKTEYNALASNLQALAKAIISLALVLLGFGVAGAITGHVASYALAAIPSLTILVLVTRKNKGDSKFEGCRVTSDLKTMLNYGIPLYVSALLTGLIPIYQNVILAFFTTDVDIGNYKAAVNFTSLMHIVAVPISTALLPAFSKLNSATKEEVKIFYRLANKYTSMMMFPLAFLIIVLAKEIVEIVYGNQYLLAPIFLAIYCPLYFLVGFGYLVLPSLYNGLGETKTTFKMSLITFITLILLSPVLAGLYSVIGLILAYILANSCGVAYGLHIAKKKFHVEVEGRRILKIFLNSAASSLPALILLNVACFSSLITVLLGAGLYMFSYLTLTPLTGAFSKFELEKVKEVVKKTRFLAAISKPIIAYQQMLIKWQG